MEKSPDQPQQKPAPAKPTGLPMFVPGISGMPQMFQPFPPIQALYANGFEISVTGPDVLVIFSQTKFSSWMKLQKPLNYPPEKINEFCRI